MEECMADGKHWRNDRTTWLLNSSKVMLKNQTACKPHFKICNAKLSKLHLLFSLFCLNSTQIFSQLQAGSNTRLTSSVPATWEGVCLSVDKFQRPWGESGFFWGRETGGASGSGLPLQGVPLFSLTYWDPDLLSVGCQHHPEEKIITTTNFQTMLMQQRKIKAKSRFLSFAKDYKIQ